jgi:hypothetical protein
VQLAVVAEDLSTYERHARISYTGQTPEKHLSPSLSKLR